MTQPESKQQLIRCAIREHWETIVGESLGQAIECAQVEAAVSYVMGKLWPNCQPELLTRLAGQDGEFLLSAASPSSNLKTHLEAQVCAVAIDYVPEPLRSSEHANGSGLRKLIANELSNPHVWSNVQRRVEALFQSRGTDKLNKPSLVFEGVLNALCKKVHDELAAQVGQATVSQSAIHHLKVITALVDRHGNPKMRVQRLVSLTDHCTASLPYIAKYVHREGLQRETAMPIPRPETQEKLDARLTGCFGEARRIQNCIDAFRSGNGVLSPHVSPDSPIRPELQEWFDAIPPYVEPVETNLTLSKLDGVRLSRERKSALVDGVVCVVTCTAQVESLLRQVVHVEDRLGVEQLRKLRPYRLIARVKQHVCFTQSTDAFLAWLFSEDFLAVRDALAHGAFYANDWMQVKQTTAIVEHGIHDLVHDLSNAGVIEKVLGAERWDRFWHLTTEAFENQQKRGLNLADQAHSEAALEHYAKVLKKLVPDKSNMGMAGFLLWVKEQAAEREGRGDETNSFAAIVANLVVVESLLRAVLEFKGHVPVTISTDGEKRVKCTLHMLTDSGSQLLSDATLSKVFGPLQAMADFNESVKAVGELRDHVMHGAWGGIVPPYARYAHLVGKLLFALALEVNETSFT